MLEESLSSLRVNGGRLWERLMVMAQIGATSKGGVCRVALTDEDKAGRDLFVHWCQEAGCNVTIDQIGNIFARRDNLGSGSQEHGAPVLVGSHLDSQPTGGKYDGAVGVLAGLEVINTLNDHNIFTTTPVEIVSWTNEEGARFAPAMIGSGVFSGAFELDFALSIKDKNGVSIGEELQRIGYAGPDMAGGRPFKAAFELHIEQGAVLESAGKSIGIVTGVQGMRWYEVVIAGKEAHAGTTPMNLRNDPVKGLVTILKGFYELADQFAPQGRVTMGDIRAEPGVINTVPGRLNLKVDLRHPETATLEVMHQTLGEIVREGCRVSGLSGQIHEIWHSPPVTFDEGCIDAVRLAVDSVGVPGMNMVSGAGHDAVYLARIAPTSMIFIPCEDGLSHNELEKADRADVIAGANVLLQAVLAQAA